MAEEGSLLPFGIDAADAVRIALDDGEREIHPVTTSTLGFVRNLHFPQHHLLHSSWCWRLSQESSASLQVFKPSSEMKEDVFYLTSLPQKVESLGRGKREGIVLGCFGCFVVLLGFFKIKKTPNQNKTQL